MVPAEFDSVLLNLVSNAIKAIGESSSSARGKIRIALIAKGEDLQVCVADNGCGVSKRVESVMFEPLEGKFAEGTGMGLPIVKFIAERYLGSVALHAAPSGYATELRVLLKGVVK
jgi:signal transduction histidine kinase